MPADTIVQKHFKEQVQSSAPYRSISPSGFIPARETVLVRRHDKMDRTEGGIVLPDAAQEESVTGEVIAVSEGEEFLQVGDIVLIDLTAAENPAARPFSSDRNLIVLHCYQGRETDILGKFRLPAEK